VGVDPTMFRAHHRMQALPSALSDSVEIETSFENQAGARRRARMVGGVLNEHWERTVKGLTRAVRRGHVALCGRRKGADGRIAGIETLDSLQIVFRESGEPYACLPDNCDVVWDRLRFKASEVTAAFPRAALEASPPLEAAPPLEASASPALEAPTKHAGGAPEKYDWVLVQEILEKECKEQGSIPHSNHSDPDWRTKAHAIKYVCKQMARDWRDGEPADSTLKKRVGAMLAEIEEGRKLVIGLPGHEVEAPR
jgi:hypothetical protein